MGLSHAIQTLLRVSSVAAALGCGVARADPGAEANSVLRVRSMPHFTAVRVAPTAGGQRVEGLLQDEQNSALEGVPVQTAEKLPTSPCKAGSNITDAEGRFCLVLSADTDSATLAFAGNTHFDATSHQVSLDRTVPPPSVTLRTSPEWFVGQVAPPVLVRVDNAPPGDTNRLRLKVYDLAHTERASFVSELDGPETSLPVETSQFPPAGPLVLEAALLSGTSELARASTTVDWIAPVELRLEGFPAQVRSGDTFNLDVRATGDLVVVNSGWVEVREGQKPLVIEPVRDGQVQLAVELAGSRERRTQLTVEYVSEKPWYRPTAAVRQDVQVLGPLPWLHLPWALLAAGAAFWVVRTWKRPSRALFQSPRGALGGGARGTIRASPGPSDNWVGTVRDAHTKQPLARVDVRLFAPALEPREALREGTTDEDGRFILPGVRPVPEGARLLFTSRSHSTLGQLAPGPCHMEVEMVERRRTLLSTFIEWAKGGSLTQVGEPTPRSVANLAHRDLDAATTDWASQIDEAVYGPSPPDSALEERLIRDRPAAAQSGAKGR